MLSLYFHWPFCAKKCPYCDYNTHVRAYVDHDKWQKSYGLALKSLFDKTGPQKIPSIFFGGGTPSLMPPTLVSHILETVTQYFDIIPTCEITLEANPTHIEATKFQDFKDAGINRVSIGVQALDQESLTWLGRQHSPAQALTAVEQASHIFERWSADLMYGRPNLSVSNWQQELTTILDLGAAHISCYQLTVMPETPLFRYYQRGDFSLPDDDILLEMDTVTKSITLEHNLNHYEISSYSKQNHECWHNLHYWHYNSYAGIGPGAHGRLHIEDTIVATAQQKHPEKWLNDPTDYNIECLNQKDKVQEYILLGLRQKSGINLESFKAKTGTDFLELPYQELVAENFLMLDDKNIKATSKGWQFLNYVEQTLL